MKEKCALVPVDNELLKVKMRGNFRFLYMEVILHTCTTYLYLLLIPENLLIFTM